MALNYIETEDDDAESFADALREMADERGYTATPDPAASVAEAARRAPAPAADPPPTSTMPPIESSDDMSTGMPDDVRAFEEGMARYRTSNGRLPELPESDRAIAEDPDSVMDDMTEDEILAYAAESDPYEAPAPAEPPVSKLRGGRSVKGGGAATEIVPTPTTDSDSARAAAAAGGAFDNMSDDAGPDWMEQPDVSGKPRRPSGTKGGSTFLGAAPADDDSPGLVTTPGTMPDPADEAGRFLADYDMSALDALDDPSIATGEEPRFVPLTDEAMAMMEEPINEIDMSGIEPFTITGDPLANPLQGMDDAARTTRDRGTSLEGRGARVPGTLDMSRPSVQMPDGSAATVRSASFGTDDGEVLLPTISPDGREWTDDEAFDAYLSGGGHLGIYDTPEAATAAAESIHESEAGYPADDNEAIEAALGIDDDELAELQGADAADRGMEYASGYATDEDPVLPGSINPDFAEGAPGGQGPGGWADDDDPTIDAAALDAMEGVEPGGAVLADPRGPEAKVPTEPGTDPRALDAGLPGEAELGAARTNDVIRQIFGRISNAARGARGGGAPIPIRSEASELEAERRRGIRDRLSAKGATEAADRRAERDAASARELASIRDEPSELELSREARMAADSERRASMDARRLDLEERGLSGREGRAADEAAREAAMRDPASPASSAARQRLAATLSALRSSPRTRPIADALSEGLESMSAYDVERIESGSMLRPLMGRGGGVAGGGGGGAMTDALRAQLEARGLDPALVDALGVRGARAVLARETEAPEGAAGEGELDPRELITGVRVGVELSSPERAALRHDWRAARGAFDALATLERAVSGSNVAERLLDPGFQATINPALARLRGIAAQIQGSGIINPGELPVINATIPNPAEDRVAFGAFVDSLQEWRRMLAAQIETGLADYNVNEDGIRRAMSALRGGGRIARGEPSGGGSSAPAGPSSAPMRVRDTSSGDVLTIDASDWEALDPAARSEFEVVE